MSRKIFLQTDEGQYINRNFLISMWIEELEPPMCGYMVYGFFAEMGKVAITGYESQEKAQEYIKHTLDVGWLAGTNRVIGHYDPYEGNELPFT